VSSTGQFQHVARLAAVQRILVYGVTGSGKSTLAARTAGRLGLPFYAMDDLTWEQGWVPVPEQEQRRRVAEVVANEAWVIDASYGSWNDLVLERVELIVGLDLPRAVSLSRLVRRTLSHIVRRTPTCNGNIETWRSTFFDRDSILVWHFRSFRRKRLRMRRWHSGPEFPETVLLRSSAEVEEWYAALPRFRPS
jgi:adenylate kinase family enzyme